MARRKEHTHEQISQMAISFIVDYLETQSLSSLSLRKVALGIGYVPSTLINIFGSYQYLLLAVSAHTLQTLDRKLEDCLLHCTALSAIEQLQHMAQTYYQFANNYSNRFKLVFELSLDDTETLPETQNQLINGLFDKISSRLQIIFPNASQQDIELMSRVIWSGIHGITSLDIDNKLFITHTNTAALLNSHIADYVAGKQITAQQ